MGGKLKPDTELINQDGKEVGKIKKIQSEGKGIDEATQGQEVAISLPGANFERQLKDSVFLYSNINETQFRQFKENKSLLSLFKLKTYFWWFLTFNKIN